MVGTPSPDSARSTTTTRDSSPHTSTATTPAPPSQDLRNAIPTLLKHFHTNDPGDAVFVVVECPTHRGSYTVTDYDKNRESITMDRQNTYILPANAAMMRELLASEEAVCTH
jgi:hypothetical protein